MATPVASNPVDRTAQLLSLVLDRSPRTTSELAAALGASPEELEPLIAALERHELVQWDGDHGQLHPGPRALRFARSGLAREDIADLAAPSLQRLADESSETVNLMVPTSSGTQAIAQRDGRHLLGATNWIGRDVPDHASAAGKVFLAHGVARIAQRLQAVTDRTIVDGAALERELEAARARGYATAVDELEPGLAVVAAPVFDADGGVVAALAISGPASRLTEHRLALLGRVAIEQAHALSARLGYEGSLEDVL
jgi:DNA-binding IclR family transcriptional regulator